MPTLSCADAWIICSRPRPLAHMRLFCLPYAGGGSAIYRTWSDNVPVDVEVCAIQLPGRGHRLREPAFTQLTPLVEALASAIRPYLTLPFAFFGHSMGALIGFELARFLRSQAAPTPVRLFISGRKAPHLPIDRSIHDLPDAAFVEELRRYNGTSDLILQNAELLKFLLPILRADFAVCETYSYLPEPPLDCAISAFGGTQDHKASFDDLTAWRQYTDSSFTIRLFPGDHFFVHSARVALLVAVSQDLARLPDRIMEGQLCSNVY